ncbi:MAG: TIGR00725 family protein [Desulfobacterales bacterium]|nr:TIGR00725 family protein [Desulfobacterales bacterium]
MAPTGNQSICLAVIGGGNAAEETCRLARLVGHEAALRGWILITGGLGGVMEAAAKGAQMAGGLTVGILPGVDRSAANPYIRIAVATGTGQARNAVIVHTADALIAVDGEYGTLSEVALGLKLGKPVVGLKTPWNIPGMLLAETPGEAVEKVARILGVSP